MLTSRWDVSDFHLKPLYHSNISLLDTLPHQNPTVFTNSSLLAIGQMYFHIFLKGFQQQNRRLLPCALSVFDVIISVRIVSG